MKRFLIHYTLLPDSGPVDAWNGQVRAFIQALDADPELRGRIRYRCMKARDRNEYFHLAEPLDDEAAKLLGERDWFKRYTQEMRRVGGASFEVLPLDTIAETS